MPEVAAFLGVTLRTVQNWTTAGKLPHRKLSHRCVRFNLAEVDAATRDPRARFTGRAA